MHSFDVPIQFVRYAAKAYGVPRYETPGAAGCDLHACVDAPLKIAPGEILKVPTGIAVSLPASCCALVFARSGLASRSGIAMANGVGVVDSDYTGEILCPVINLGTQPFTIEPGMRIAQMLIMPVFTARFIEVETLQKTQRGDGGFGSTGV